MTERKKPEEKKKTGRPTMYSPELAEKICDLIKQGLSERKIGAMSGMPDASTIYRWKDEYPEFCKQSARAREASAEKFNDDLIELQEHLKDQLMQRLFSGEDFPKGTVEAYKTLMHEYARQAGLRDDSRFGDRKKVALTGADGGAIAIEQKTTLDLSNLTIEELHKLDMILANANTPK